MMNGSRFLILLMAVHCIDWDVTCVMRAINMDIWDDAHVE